MDRKILIITGSGRCGTAAFAKAFGGFHEYGVNKLLKSMPQLQTAFPREYPFDTEEKREKALDTMYEGMEKHDPFVDSNNMARHFLDIIDRKYRSKFLLLTRNGKDFCVSAGNRLWDMYNILDHIPLWESPCFHQFIDMRRLEKLAWIWYNSNMLMLMRSEKIPPERKMMVKIEDCRDERFLNEIEDFAGIKMVDRSVLLKKKVNINTYHGFFVKKDAWTVGMHMRFDAMAGQMMKELGYEA